MTKRFEFNTTLIYASDWFPLHSDGSWVLQYLHLEAIAKKTTLFLRNKVEITATVPDVNVVLLSVLADVVGVHSCLGFSLLQCWLNMDKDREWTLC